MGTNQIIIYPPLLKRGITIAPWLILIPQWARHDAAYLAHEQVHATHQRKLLPYPNSPNILRK